MDIELLRERFSSILTSGISVQGVLSGLPERFAGDTTREITAAWLNLKADEVRGLYGFSAPYAGSVITADLPGVSNLSPNEIRKLKLSLSRAGEFDILSILDFQGVGVRFDLARAMRQ